MELRFLLNTVRRRPISLVCTFLLVVLIASFGDIDVLAALGVWLSTSALALVVWRRFERSALRLVGGRPLSERERDSLKPLLECITDELLVVDRAQPWLVRGLRSIVVGSGMLELLDERKLRGLLTHASLLDTALIAAELVVWIGILPLKLAWHLGTWLEQLGRLLAILVGTSLVIPMFIWPSGFVRWGGRLFGALLGFMLSSLLLTSGVTLVGASLMTAWAIVPAMRWLLAWEFRRAERVADEAVIQMGLGWELVGGLEDLLWFDPQPVPPEMVGLLFRGGAPIRQRLDRAWQALTQARETQSPGQRPPEP
jgi:hypothetical protein